MIVFVGRNTVLLLINVIKMNELACTSLSHIPILHLQQTDRRVIV